jgi:hypothetical protein
MGIPKLRAVPGNSIFASAAAIGEERFDRINPAVRPCASDAPKWGSEVFLNPKVTILIF